MLALRPFLVFPCVASTITTSNFLHRMRTYVFCPIVWVKIPSMKFEGISPCPHFSLDLMSQMLRLHATPLLNAIQFLDITTTHTARATDLRVHNGFAFLLLALALFTLHGFHFLGVALAVEGANVEAGEIMAEEGF
jgi:hypothetical protein